MTLKSAGHVSIRKYIEKDLERIIRRHRELYENEYGFTREFGDYVEKYLYLFHDSMEVNKGELWIAEENGEFAGVVAVVKAGAETAQLRWFLVEPDMRGKGIGNLLMKTAIDYCAEKKYKHVMLWTVNILEAARHLYRKFSFALTQTKVNTTWGNGLFEEQWDLQLER